MDFEYFYSLIFMAALLLYIYDVVIRGLFSLFNDIFHEDNRVKIDFRN
jgi:hypothetical protein